MTNYSIEQQQFGLKKETVRGTAETTITTYIPIDPSSLPEYKLNLINDENLRGIAEIYPPIAGTLDGAAPIKIDVDPDHFGEILNSLLGHDTVTNLSPAYVHTFDRLTSGIQFPSYSLFLDRGMNKKVYNLSVCKSLQLTQSVDGKLSAQTQWIFQQEASSSATFTPAWSQPNPFSFYQNALALGGSSNYDIKTWSITIDNQAKALRKLTGKQYIADVICADKFKVNGTFTIIFEDETERAKFLANTSSSLTITITGSIIPTTATNYSLTITIPEIHYTAFPFGEDEKLLAANVTFDAFYNISAAKSIEVALANTIAAY